MTLSETLPTDSESVILAHLQRAMEALRRGDIVLSASEADKARSLGQSARVLMVFAAISHAAGRDSDALLMLDQAMKLEPTVGNYPDAVAAIYLKLGRKADGLFNLKLGTHLSHDSFLTEIVGDYFGSVKAIFDSFIENRPLKTAKLLMEQEMYQSAFGQLETFIAVSGGDVESFALIAECALRMGRSTDAEVALGALRALDASDTRLLDLEFQLAVLNGDEVATKQAFDALLPAITAQQAIRRLSAMVSSPYFSFSDISFAHRIINSLIEPVKGVDLPVFKIDESSLVLAFFISRVDSALESLILALNNKVKIKIYFLGTGHSLSQQRLKNAIEDWRDVAAVDDATLTEMVRSDNVSILCDCVVLSSFSRLSVIRARVAPIQIAWQTDDGYDDVASYDYRLTDIALEPKASGQRILSLRLPLRYPLAPAEFLGRIAELRSQEVTRIAGEGDQIRLLAPHNPATVSSELLNTWMSILEKAPKATLTLIAPSDINNPFVQTILAAATRRSVADRVDLIDPVAFMETRHTVLLDSDLILDSFPRNNLDAMTEALWIGCPILTVAGDRPYESLSASLARSANMLDLVTHSDTEYRVRAVQLATHPEELSALRENFKLMHRSLTLSAYEKTADELFQKLDALWREWCKVNA